MISKHYYLFGIRIWTVIHEGYIAEPEEEIEEEESDSGSLDAAVTQPNSSAPDFGFTPWTPHWVTTETED